MRPDDDAEFAGIAWRRARVLSPIVLGAQVVTFALSEPAGVPLHPAVAVYNVLAIAILVGLTLRTRRELAGAWSHVALAAVWWIPVGGTLCSAAFNHDPRLLNLLLLETFAIAVLVRSTWAIFSLAALLSFAVPLVLRDQGANADMAISALVTGGLLGLVLQGLVQRALHEAHVHRRSSTRIASELSARLAESRASDQERVRLQDKLLHAQRLEAMATLAGGMAHDMNNVLAAIANSAELLPSDAVGDPALLRSIIDHTRRGAELTRSVLAYAQRGQYEKRHVRVADVLGEILPPIERSLPANCTIHTRVDAALAIEADRVQIGQVVGNLVENAVQAMPDGGRIDVAVERAELDEATAQRLQVTPGTYVRCEVRDGGRGIDASALPRIFEPFFTTKARGVGTGLGLALVWGVVRAHGGAVEVDSRPGETRFTVFLPASSKVPIALPVAGEAPALAAGTILVVDDEQLVRNTTKRILTRAGYQVLTAENGEEALAVFGRHSAEIGLVILDMGMPVMGGAECFARLRATSSVPVLVASGFAVDAEMQHLVAQGAELLQKPYRSAELLKLVADLLAVDARSTGERRPSVRTFPDA